MVFFVCVSEGKGEMGSACVGMTKMEDDTANRRQWMIERPSAIEMELPEDAEPGMMRIILQMEHILPQTDEEVISILNELNAEFTLKHIFRAPEWLMFDIPLNEVARLISRGQQPTPASTVHTTPNEI